MMDQQVKFQSTMNGKVPRSKTHQVVTKVFNFMELRGRVATFIIDPKKGNRSSLSHLRSFKMYFNKIQWVEKETGRNTLLLTGILGTPYKLRPLTYTRLEDFNNCVVC